VTLTNRDLNDIITFYINYYKIVIVGKKFTKQPFYASIKVSIVKKHYVGYFKFYYALLDLKKVVISACFSVTLSLRSLITSLCILSTKLNFSIFLASSHIFCVFAL